MPTPTPEAPIRIAMWSGPRNISTAMMRSWGNRADTIVCDEPLYAHYLRETGLDHPGAHEVIAHHNPDWQAVVTALVGPVPQENAIYYQKHMAHHLLPNIDRGWLDQVSNAFLIRSPREMLTSLAKVLGSPRLEDTGFPQQWEIFERVSSQTGRTPPVIDAKDVLDDPRGVLSALCEALGVPFDEAMLHWPAGPRDTDGIWAKYWYDNVERSTGFQPYTPKPDQVPEHLADVLDRAESFYERLYAQRIRP